MRQNSKSFGADLAVGEELVNSALLETSNAPTHLDGSLMMSQEPLSASGSVASEYVGAGQLSEIVGDMTLLADMVIKRRAVRSSGLDAQDWQGLLAADPSDPKEPTFPAVRIAMTGEELVHVVDSIERAVECLTTLWPVRNGEAFEYALQICIDGIRGRVSPQQVRSAFVDAAGEAGILILP